MPKAKNWELDKNPSTFDAPIGTIRQWRWDKAHKYPHFITVIDMEESSFIPSEYQPDKGRYMVDASKSMGGTDKKTIFRYYLDNKEDAISKAYSIAKSYSNGLPYRNKPKIKVIRD